MGALHQSRSGEGGMMAVIPMLQPVADGLVAGGNERGV